MIVVGIDTERQHMYLLRVNGVDLIYVLNLLDLDKCVGRQVVVIDRILRPSHLRFRQVESAEQQTPSFDNRLSNFVQIPSVTYTGNIVTTRFHQQYQCHKNEQRLSA